MFITTQFSIKDLENLSGVKAHTIRIWEKRYKLLEPTRTETNIRKYDLHNLKKLLNITLLYNNGLKISKIAKHNTEEINQLSSELAQTNREDYSLQAFKTAMFDFDHQLFTKTYTELCADRTFEEIFENVFIPLLHEIGMLWQTGTIDPSHERFISELIKQKIIVSINEVQLEKSIEQAPRFALFLPLEEIHEIGLLYANYLILSSGFQTAYLGTNIPIKSLKYILKHHSKITFLSYFTVKPDTESIYHYISRFEEEICVQKPVDFWIMGYKVQDVIPAKLPKHISVVSSLKDLSAKLQKLKLS